jgi:hypothetical protein
VAAEHSNNPHSLLKDYMYRIDVKVKGLNNDKTDVKVKGFTNGISNKYNINSFYYSIGNHTQRRFQSDDLSLLAHYKILT